MARSVSDINPSDVFPPRNLPGSSEAWGRVVEDREIALEKGHLSQDGSIAGLNRTFAALQSTTAGQIDTLTLSISELTLPVIASNSRTTLSLPLASTSPLGASVLKTLVIVPAGYTRAEYTLIATLTGQNNGTVASTLYCAVRLDGSSLPSLRSEGTTDTTVYKTLVINNSGSLTGLTPGSNVTIDVMSCVSGSWGVSGGKTAFLSGMFIFKK